MKSKKGRAELVEDWVFGEVGDEWFVEYPVHSLCHG